MVQERYKTSVEFSQRLNDWILDRVQDISFIWGDYPEVDFETFVKETEENGYMKISDQHCENNIFGNKHINVAFRAWHDEIHVKLNEGFGYMEEARVAFAQCAELPQDWHEEKMLLMTEIIGQAAYHEKTGEFVPNQRKFTVECLRDGKI